MWHSFLWHKCCEDKEVSISLPLHTTISIFNETSKTVYATHIPKWIEVNDYFFYNVFVDKQNASNPSRALTRIFSPLSQRNARLPFQYQLQTRSQRNSLPPSPYAPFVSGLFMGIFPSLRKGLWFCLTHRYCVF